MQKCDWNAQWRLDAELQLSVLQPRQLPALCWATVRVPLTGWPATQQTVGTVTKSRYKPLNFDLEHNKSKFQSDRQIQQKFNNYLPIYLPVCHSIYLSLQTFSFDWVYVKKLCKLSKLPNILSFWNQGCINIKLFADDDVICDNNWLPSIIL